MDYTFEYSPVIYCNEKYNMLLLYNTLSMWQQYKEYISFRIEDDEFR
jgi:hypothetical protein